MTPRLTPDEARKLLGGYATGTLTAGEREGMLAAALEDQSLFDALAEEDALRELLEAPGAKTRLLAQLREGEEEGWVSVAAAAAASAPAHEPVAAKPEKRGWFGLPWLTGGRALSFAGLAAMAVVTVSFLSQKPAVLPERPAAVTQGAPVAGPVEEKKAGATAAGRGSAERAKTLATSKVERERRAATASPVSIRESDAPPVAEPPAAVPTAPTAAASPANAQRKQADVKSLQGPVAVSAETVQVAPAQSANQLRADETQSLPTPSQQQPMQAGRSAPKRPQPAPRADAEKKAADSMKAGVGAGTLSASKSEGTAPLTLRYKLERGRRDAPTEITVETSSGFAYVLRRTGDSWDTVASGNGPHSLDELGEYAIVASSTELANPAGAVRGAAARGNMVSRMGDGFTAVTSPESTVFVLLRVRAR